MSQDELGAQSDINGQTISNIELDRVDPRGETFRKLAKGLNLTVEELDAEIESELKTLRPAAKRSGPGHPKSNK